MSPASPACEAPTLPKQNLFDNLARPAAGEASSILATCRNVTIERIVSSDRPEPVLYDQTQDEWVLLLQGEARLLVADEEIALGGGDCILLPAHTPHRVLATSRTPPCIWLAVHIHPA